MLKVKDRKETHQEPAGKEAFKATTRCDQCGAQAYVRAVKADTDLFFCIHHSGKNKEGLVAQGFMIDDRSWALS